MLASDGAYLSDTAEPVFRRIAPPREAELQALVEQLAQRVGRSLERQGLLVRDAENDLLVFEPEAGGARRPERTAPYRLVQQHLETWLAHRRERDADGVPIPRHIERELRGYLECGILACGFARARCGDCGHDFLISFCCAPSLARTLRAPFGRPNSLPANLSCKGRGLCPSCTTRRRAETAAHLVEHVFPQVPVRQWVVTFPRRLRHFLHRDPVLLGRVRRCVLRAIESGLRRRCPDAPAGSRFGAVGTCRVARRAGSGRIAAVDRLGRTPGVDAASQPADPGKNR